MASSYISKTSALASTSRSHILTSASSSSTLTSSRLPTVSPATLLPSHSHSYHGASPTRPLRRKTPTDVKLENIAGKVLRVAAAAAKVESKPQLPLDNSLLGFRRTTRRSMPFRTGGRRYNDPAVGVNSAKLHTSTRLAADAAVYHSRSSGGISPLYSRKHTGEQSTTEKPRQSKLVFRGQWSPREDILPGDFVELRLIQQDSMRGIVLNFSPQVEASERIRLATAAAFEPGDGVITSSDGGGLVAGAFILLDCTGNISLQQGNDVTLHIPNFLHNEDHVHLALARLAPDESVIQDKPIYLQEEGGGLPPSREANIEGMAGDQGVWQPLSEVMNTSTNTQLIERQKARAKLGFIIRQFLREVETKLEGLRKSFQALTSDERWVQERQDVTILDVAHQLDKGALSSEDSTVSYPTLLATHMLLWEKNELFLPDRLKFRFTGRYLIRSQRSRRDLRQVQQWVEENMQNQAGVLASFVKKVKDALKQSKNPSGATVSPIQWTAEDKTIFSVLLDGISVAGFKQSNFYATPLSYILKACERLPWSPPEVFRNSPEMGFEGWESSYGSAFHTMVVDMLEDLAIFPKDGVAWTLVDENAKDVLEVAILLEKEQQEAKKQIPHARQDTPDSLALQDYDEALRKDFHGDVYIIDDAAAYELDDGISIEPAGQEGKFWIHCHIADPSSHMLPTDDAAVRAKKQGATIYTPLTYVPMFADKIPDIASQIHTGGSRALTISALVNSDGSVEEFDIAPTMLRKVHVMTYTQVDKILRDRSQAPNEKMAEDLHTLYRFAIHMHKRRVRNGAFLAGTDNLKVVMPPATELPELIVPSPYTLMDPHLQRLFKGDNVKSDPSKVKSLSQLSLGISRQSYKAGPENPATLMVSTMMILANRVAAAFLGRDGPTAAGSRLLIPYRGQAFAASRAEKIGQAIGSMKDEFGNIDYQRVVQASIEVPAATAAAHPLDHVSLGVRGTEESPYFRGIRREDNVLDAVDGWGYTRATSPLRRYSDLVTHWQIKSLLHQRASSRNPRKGLSEEEILEWIPKMTRQGASAATFEKFFQRYWKFKALRTAWEQALANPNVTLPPPAEGCISPSTLLQPQAAFIADCNVRIDTQSKTTYIRVQLKDFGLWGDCIWPVKDSATNPVIGKDIKVVFGHISEHLHGGTLKFKLA